jgi:hypothetical protein
LKSNKIKLILLYLSIVIFAKGLSHFSGNEVLSVEERRILRRNTINDQNEMQSTTDGDV